MIAAIIPPKPAKILIIIIFKQRLMSNVRPYSQSIPFLPNKMT